MTAVKYNQYSPYLNTKQLSKYVDYLDFWQASYIPASSNDILISLDPKYNKRPDLLSYDLYGTPQLWWVFAMRNPDTIKDPIYDFKAGAVIYAPSKDNIGIYI